MFHLVIKTEPSGLPGFLNTCCVMSIFDGYNQLRRRNRTLRPITLDEFRQIIDEIWEGNKDVYVDVHDHVDNTRDVIKLHNLADRMGIDLHVYPEVEEIKNTQTGFVTSQFIPFGKTAHNNFINASRIVTIVQLAGRVHFNRMEFLSEEEAMEARLSAADPEIAAALRASLHSISEVPRNTSRLELAPAVDVDSDPEIAAALRASLHSISEVPRNTSRLELAPAADVDSDPDFAAALRASLHSISEVPQNTSRLELAPAVDVDSDPDFAAALRASLHSISEVPQNTSRLELAPAADVDSDPDFAAALKASLHSVTEAPRNILRHELDLTELTSEQVRIELPQLGSVLATPIPELDSDPGLIAAIAASLEHQRQVDSELAIRLQLESLADPNQWDSLYQLYGALDAQDLCV